MPVTTLHELCRATCAAACSNSSRSDLEGAEQGAAQRRLAELPAEGRRGRGACALHPGAGLAGFGNHFSRNSAIAMSAFDSLNRYYLAEEASELAALFRAAPARSTRVFSARHRSVRRSPTPAIQTRSGHAAGGNDMTHLPFVGARRLRLERSTADRLPRARTRPAGARGHSPTATDMACSGTERRRAAEAEGLKLPPVRRCAKSMPPSSTADQFRAALRVVFPGAMPGMTPLLALACPLAMGIWIG